MYWLQVTVKVKTLSQTSDAIAKRSARVMGEYSIRRQSMSEQIKTSALEKSPASKIQIEVKEIAPQTTRKNTKSLLNVDADGDDIRNE